MCILIVKPKDKLVPSKEILEECFDRNPDGAGFCYNKNGMIVIRKGFMNFEEFYKATEKIPTESTALIHCRIGTSGGNIPELTHPYPLTNNIKDLKKTTMLIKSSGDKPVYAVGHNGIFYEYNSRVTDINDTCAFIANILHPLNCATNDILDENLVAIINKLVGTSKIAILDNNGNVRMFGDGWIEDDGIYYSNGTYKKITYTYNYGRYDRYDFLNDDDEYLYGYDSDYKWNRLPYDKKLKKLIKDFPDYKEDIEDWAMNGWLPSQIRSWLEYETKEID